MALPIAIAVSIRKTKTGWLFRFWVTFLI